MNTKTTTKTATKTATKATASKATATKATAVKASMGTFATVKAMLKAYGLSPINEAHHRAAGRFTEEGTLTEAGSTFFRNRGLDLQSGLKTLMGKHAAKPFAVADKSGTAHKFIPVSGAPLTHAPANPGAYSAGPIRAWFALAVVAVAFQKA